MPRPLKVLMMTERTSDLLRRAGIHPIALDKRPLSEVFNDEIPYRRWAREKAEGKPYRPPKLLPEC